MDRVNLFEFWECQETFHFFAIVINVASDISFNRSIRNLFNKCFAEVLEEYVEGLIKLEALFNRYLIDYSFILSEKLIVLFKLS